MYIHFLRYKLSQDNQNICVELVDIAENLYASCSLLGGQARPFRTSQKALDTSMQATEMSHPLEVPFPLQLLRQLRLDTCYE